MPEHWIVMITFTDDWALKTTKMYFNMETVFLEKCHLTKKKVEGLPLWNDSSTWNMTFQDCNGSTEEIAQHRIRSTLRIYSRIGSIDRGALVVMYQKVPVYRFYHVYKPCEEPNKCTFSHAPQTRSTENFTVFSKKFQPTHPCLQSDQFWRRLSFKPRRTIALIFLKMHTLETKACF